MSKNKSRRTTIDYYNRKVKNKQEDAIKHAKRLLLEYDRPNPETDNPSTTVYLLVEELNSFIPKSYANNSL